MISSTRYVGEESRRAPRARSLGVSLDTVIEIVSGWPRRRAALGLEPRHRSRPVDLYRFSRELLYRC